MRPDLRQFYDNLTIMPKLRSDYDGCFARLFLGMIHLHYRKMVYGVHKLAYDIPLRNLLRVVSHYRKSILR